jgi:UDP-N-acetylglucosamine 4,6-dehydratase/5-epimerase
MSELGSVLITGGAGFFGRAMARRMLDASLSERVCIFSRDEFKQAEMRRLFGDDKRLRFFIGDVRDRKRLEQAMEGVDVVIHAAALKRIEVGAYNPEEMAKTNVIGSMNVIDAAHACGVERVVFLSTDKAWQPQSPYGQTKALAESLFIAANETYGEHGPEFAVTRYGNVAGSTGSVIPTWRAMKAAGQLVVPCSDPEVTRFWMTEDEAVELVLRTIERMPKQVVIPELPAYRLGDLAVAMGLQTKVTGLPAYEKRHEGMGPGNTSDVAPRMSIEQLMEALARV